MNKNLSDRRFSWVTSSLLFDVLGIFALILSLFLLVCVVQPVIGSVSYAVGSTTGVSSLPLDVTTPEESGRAQAKFHMNIPTLAPRWYSIRARECVKSMLIDGRDVSDVLPPCHVIGGWQRINLAPFLSRGSHSFVVDIAHTAIESPLQFDLRPSAMDPLTLFIKLLIIGVFFSLLYFLISAIRLVGFFSLQRTHFVTLHFPSILFLIRFLKNPIALAWTMFVVLILAYVAVQPRLLSGYTEDSLHQRRIFHEAFRAPHDNEETYELNFTVEYGWLRPPTLRIIPDDCLKNLVVNGTHIAGFSSEVCGYDSGVNVNVSHVIHRGINTVQATVRNAGGAGSLRIETNLVDPLVSLILFLLALTGGSALWMTLRYYRPRDYQIVTAIIFFGIALRAVYFFATPYHVRSNDVDGHIEYAHYILDHSKLPGMRDMWESFQPPLYYLVSAGAMGVGRVFHAIGFNDVMAMQSMSPIFSILGFLLCIGIIGRLIDAKKHQYEFALAVLMLSVLPGAIYNAGRVNNDVFVQFFIILGLYYLVRCFDRDRRQFRFWIYACIALVLGITSKTNALIFAPPLVLATPFIFIKQGWKKWLFTAMIVLVTVGTYLGTYAIRNPQKDNIVPTNIVTNSTTLHSALMIPNTWVALSTFSPVQVFLHPFNDAWGDESRRSYFLEYLFKSSFFGEWGFSDDMLLIARFLVLSTMLCFPLTLLGTFFILRGRSVVGIILILYGLSALVLHGVFRYYYPFSPSQDFRYISSIAVSVSAITAYGLTCLPRRLRLAGGAVTLMYIGSALAFFVQLLS